MKKIPLHSLVLLVGGNKQSRNLICNYFPQHEILSFEKIEKELTDTVNRQDIYNLIKQELLHKVHLKLQLGERVVVNSPNLKKEHRMELAEISRKFDNSIFYIVLPTNNNSFQTNEKKILQGDSIAEVIDYRKEPFNVIKKLPLDNLYDSLKQRKFKGITAIGDVHGVKESLKSAVEWAIGRNHFIIFLGDIVDYGPKPIECINEVYDIVVSGRGALVYGNHERKIQKWMEQDNKKFLTLSEGNLVTVNAIQKLSLDQRNCFKNKYKALMNHARNAYVVENIIFTHAGCFPEMFNNHVIKYNKPELYNISLFGQFNKKSMSNTYGWVDIIPENKYAIVGHDIKSKIKPVTMVGKEKGTALFLDTGCGKGGFLSSVDIRFNSSPLRINNFNRH